MKRTIIMTVATALTLSMGAVADAKQNGNGKGKAKGHKFEQRAKGKSKARKNHNEVRIIREDRSRTQAATARGYGAGGCPPGLAKKNPPCVPPGLAKGDGDWRDDDVIVYNDVIYRPGDVIDTTYYVIDNPRRYDLEPGLVYWRVGDRVYAVDRDTAEVLAVVGFVSDLLN